MKPLTQTVTVVLTVNLIIAGFALAQAASTAPEPVSEPTSPSPPDTEAIEIVNIETRDQMQAAQNRTEAPKTAKQKATSLLSDLQMNLGRTLQPGSASRVLVIPASQIKIDALANIVEDMTIMGRIFNKQLGQTQLRQPWLAPDIFQHDSGMAEAVYLEGYGALFLRKVDFPLSPGPTVPAEEKQTHKENLDPVWEQTKQEMYDPEDARRRRVDRSEEKYNAEKVENLKTNIIKALKHATNIRGLKPDESVIFTVTGSSKPGNFTLTLTRTNQVIVHNKDQNVTRIVDVPLSGDLGLSSPTVLVVRAKRSDIEAFARGDSSLEQFRERVQIFTYPYLGGEADYGHFLF